MTGARSWMHPCAPDLDPSVFLGCNCLPQFSDRILLEACHSTKVVLIYDPSVEMLATQLLDLLVHSSAGQSLLPKPSRHFFKVALDCVQKSEAQVAYLQKKLFDNFCHRDTLLIAIGGGALSDLVGFVASTYYRGIPWIVMPTTLLAIVDASLGGKTGIDIPGYGKNLIGSFYPPSLVLADLATLLSLPNIEWQNGWAEIIKLTILFSLEKFETLENIIPKFASWNVFLEQCIREGCFEALPAQDTAHHPFCLVSIIHWAILMKLECVSHDRKESLTDGTIERPRILLNLGHTLGHAFENYSFTTNSQNSLAHGEAVAYGLIMETRLSYFAGVGFTHCPNMLLRIEFLLESFGFRDLKKYLPINDETFGSLMKVIKRDKKCVDGMVQVVLVEDVGHVAPRSTFKVSEYFIKQTIMNRVTISPVCKEPLADCLEIPVPGSKSLMNRSLLIAALSSKKILLKRILACEDSLIMIECLRALELARFSWSSCCTQILVDSRIKEGRLPLLTSDVDLYVGNSGTVSRFLLPLLPLFHGNAFIRVFSCARMAKRPFKQLMDAFDRYSCFEFCDQNCIDGNERIVHFCTVTPGRLSSRQNNHVRMTCLGSSQFISSLIIISALVRHPALSYEIVNSKSAIMSDDELSKIPSFSFVAMTRATLNDFQNFIASDSTEIHSSSLEIDWTSASYPLALACILSLKYNLNHLVDETTCQGDVIFLKHLVEHFNCRRYRNEDGQLIIDASDSTLPTEDTIEFDFQNSGDTFMTLVVLVCALLVKEHLLRRNYLFKRVRIIGIGSQNVKESNRVENIANLVNRIVSTYNILVTFNQATFDCIEIVVDQPDRHNSLSIFGKECVLEAFDDHRLFMSLFLLVFAVKHLDINSTSVYHLLDPDCTKKTWPFYYHALSKHLHF